MPSFDMDSFPFIVSYGRNSFDLVNLKTGLVESLIKGSAGNISGQNAAFYISKGVGKFDLHLTASVTTSQGDREQNWLKMAFNFDFFEILRSYG